jgi:outer membrane autotransporter protein/uncharacterized repeat protein (TIGR01451 family)
MLLARLLGVAAALGVSALQAQQPLRVAPMAVSLDGAAALQDVSVATDAGRGSVLSTAVVQVSPPNPVLPGSVVNYQIRISNSATVAVSGVRVVVGALNTLTPQFIDPALSCNGTMFALDCMLAGTIPGTDTRVLNLSVLMPPASSITPPTQSFNINARALLNDLGTNGETVTVVSVQRDFSLSGTAAPGSVVVGQPFGYNLTVNNAGPFISDWTGVQVTLDLPDQVRYRPAGNSGPFSCTGSTAPGSLILCNYTGTANGGASQGFTLGAEAVSAATSAIAALLVTAPPGTDPNGNNNSGSVGVSIAPAITMVSFAKSTLTASPANPTQPVDFQLNLSASSANNVVLTGLSLVDTLPTGLGFASVQSGAPAWSCTGSGQVVNCQLNQSLAAGASAPALVLRTTPQAGVGGQTLTNQATVSSAQVAPVSAESTVTFGTALDASAILTASQNPVASGATYSYLLGISAAGAIPVGSTATLNLPATVSLSSIPGGGGWACTGSAPTISCSRTVAVSNSTPTAEIRVTAPQVGSPTTVTAAADVSLPGNFDPVQAPTSLQVTINAVPPAIELLKSGPASVTAGSEFDYVLQVRNAGVFAVANLRVRDPLPAGMGLVSVNGAGCNAAGTTVDCLLSLAPGAAQIITLRVVAPTEPGSVTNTARAEFGEEGFVESSVQTSVTASPRADVAAAKSVDLEQVLPGGRLGYTVSVHNVGAVLAQDVELVDTLPTGVRVVSVTPSGCQVGTQIRCTVGPLAAGERQSYTILVDVANDASGVLTNAVRVSAAAEDNLSNNEATVSTRVQPPATPMADLALSAQVTPATYAGAEAELVFRVSLRNQGPSTAQAVQVGVQLPASGLSVQSAQFGGQSCALGAGGGGCSIGTLAAGAQVDGELRVRLDSALPQVTARFSASAQTMDPVVSNNSADAVASLVAQPPQAADLVLNLNGPAQVQLGTELSLSTSVLNKGPQPANGVRITSTLPATLRFVSAAGAASCTASGQTLRCDLSGNLIAGEQRAVALTLAAQNTIGPVSSSFTVSSAIADPVPADNTASYTISVGTPGDDDVIEALLSDITDVFARDAIPTVADICANPPADLAAQCDAIIRARLNGDLAGATRGLRALFPEEVLSQALSANQLAATQFTNVDARMSELRGGGGGFSISGLTVQVGQQSIPLSIFNGFGQSEEEPAIGGSGDLISPWGAFINGTISFGDQSINAQQRNTVSDFDSYSLTAGADYRRSARLVFGGALGWNRFQSDLTDEGRLDTKGWTLTGYGSWYPLERWYLDGRASYGRLDFAMQRRILIPGVVDRLAQGRTDGTQYAVALATGYHYNRGGWSITPNASLRYADTTYDPFTETGAGANNASFSENTGKSLQTSLGVSISRAFSLSQGVLLPQFDISLNREMRNQKLSIDAELLGAPGNVFRVRGDDQDRTYGSVGLGFVFVMANGRQAYLSYRELFGLDGLSRGSVNLGGRFEF